jgi:phospholipase C
MPSATGQLSQIKHIVQLMLENRSFDQMLGFLYPERDDFDGLTGNEESDSVTPNGRPVKAFKITPQPHGYHMPGCDPGEHFQDTNEQLFGQDPPPSGATATNRGFVKNFAKAIRSHARFSDTIAGTKPEDIMGMYPPEMLPVMTALAKSFAVCDQWFSSVPTQTMPNRAFAGAATSLGILTNPRHGSIFNCPSIFGRLSDVAEAGNGVIEGMKPWMIFGYDGRPLTRTDFPDTKFADSSHTGLFSDFKAHAAAGTLPAYTFLEPKFGENGNAQNDQHPNHDVAKGEQLMLDVYRALRHGPNWTNTLLIITYDEHGGNYDHVAPPATATPPDGIVGTIQDFNFDRFGVRVPALLISPWIEAGTVFRVTDGVIDHTSVLKTIQERFGTATLTERDKAAPSLAGVLTRASARTDDPLAGVSAPPPSDLPPEVNADIPSSIDAIHAARLADFEIPNEHGFHSFHQPDLSTAAKVHSYIQTRTAQWNQYVDRMTPAERKKQIQDAIAFGARRRK